MAPPKKPATLPASTQSPESLEGDYAPSRPLFHTHAPEPNIRVEPLQLDFLLRLADALNTTLDLNTLMHRVADLVRAVIDYRIFAILLINDRTHELWMRFQTGHTTEIERMRIKLGRGVVGQAALQRKSILVEDVTKLENYINANPHVLSELAVPLIVKNKVIGVLDLQSEAPAFFTPDHQRLLELTASRMAVAVENARLYTRVSRQAQTLTVLHEISHEITSILDPDDLLERIGALLKRVIDFQMFTILLWNDKSEQLEHRFSTRYGERVIRQRTVLLGQGIIGTAAQQRTPILSPDVRKDSRYFAENPETRSELSVPLIYKGKVIGVIDLEHTRVNYYNEDHQRTLTTLASQIAISIANARLYQRISEEEQRMERDLNMAREVQLRLMPAAPPQPANAEIATSFNAARSIGGDVYDFLDYGPAPNPDSRRPRRPAHSDHRKSLPGNDRRPLLPRLPHPHRHRPRRRLRQSRSRRPLRCPRQRPHAFSRPPPPAPRAASQPPQRPASGAQARLPVRHHAHVPLGRPHAHPPRRQRRLRPAHAHHPGHPHQHSGVPHQRP